MTITQNGKTTIVTTEEELALFIAGLRVGLMQAALKTCQALMIVKPEA